jgi:hypothetical protein
MPHPVEAVLKLFNQPSYNERFSVNTAKEEMGVRQRRRLRVASRATAPGPALEGFLRFRPKVVHEQETFLLIMKKTKFVRQVARVDIV